MDEINGVRYGFLGKGILDHPCAVSEAREIVARYFKVDTVVLPQQTHGDQIVLLDGTTPEQLLTGDAIVLTQRSKAERVACIRTADCLPLLVFCENKVALIHAGWRGLANGIISTTFRALGEQAMSAQVVIGPCAGAERYQVGREVIDAIGKQAVCKVDHGDRFLLDLAGTATQILSEISSDIKVLSTNICTMFNTDFYSHRRDGDKAGRNISFIFY